MSLRRYKKKWPPKLVALIDQALDLGCTFEESGNHLHLLHPEGWKLFVFPKSASDHRSHKNGAAFLRRQLRRTFR